MFVIVPEMPHWEGSIKYVCMYRTDFSLFSVVNVDEITKETYKGFS